MIRKLKNLAVWALSYTGITSALAHGHSAAMVRAADKATISEAVKTMDINLPYGVTPISHKIYELHMAIFWISVGIAVAVFGVMFYSILRHRKSLGVKASKFMKHGD